LKWLSEQPGSPAYSSLRKRSAPKKEDWEEQRRNFRNNAKAVAATTPDVQQTVEQITQIIDAAEMLTRHSKAAKLIGQIAIDAFLSYDPASLKPSEAVQMLKLAIDVERITEGLATERQEAKVDIDTLTQLSDEELLRLRDGK
jgi:hypothetical protein